MGLSLKSTAAASVVALTLAFGAGSANALTMTGVPCNVSSVSGATACEGIFEGNNSNQDLDGLFGINGWFELLKLDDNEGMETGNGITLTVNDTDKTWSVDTYNSFSPIMFVQKGGPTFSAFLMDTDVLSGTWDNESMLKGNGQRGSDLSHWSIYSTGQGNTEVSAPASIALLGGGLLALGLVRRRS